MPATGLSRDRLENGGRVKAQTHPTHMDIHLATNRRAGRFRIHMNVGFCLSEDQLRQYFSQFGQLLDVYLPKHQGSGRVRGYGFCTFENEAGLALALQVSEHVIDGVLVRISRAGPRPQYISVSKLEPARQTKNALMSPAAAKLSAGLAAALASGRPEHAVWTASLRVAAGQCTSNGLEAVPSSGALSFLDPVSASVPGNLEKYGLCKDLASVGKSHLSLQQDRETVEQGALCTPGTTAHLAWGRGQLTPQAKSAAPYHDALAAWPGTLSNPSALSALESKLPPLAGQIHTGSNSLSSQWDFGSADQQQQWMQLLQAGSSWDGQPAQALRASMASLQPSKPLPQPCTMPPGPLISQHADILLPAEADQRNTTESLAEAMSELAGLGRPASPRTAWRSALLPALPHHAHLLGKAATHSSLQQVPTTSLSPQLSNGTDQLTAMILGSHATFPLGSP